MLKARPPVRPISDSIDPSLDPLTAAALTGVTRALASVGRAFVCLDPAFRVVHASYMLDDWLGEGTADRLRGHLIEDLLGADLFGANGALSEALKAGERREGWRGTLRFGDAEPRLVSLTAAPLLPESAGICDPRIAHLVILRPAEDEGAGHAPTFFSGAVASSAAMQRVFRLVDNLQHSEATVLITGESGTGKEIVARAIHQHSPRRDGPFVAVNSGALPADLLESELFGHVRGAFTGAVRDRVGRFELASRGTLFLDEVGDLPVAVQAKLLRVLQERTFERLGESESRTTGARIIAATHVDLNRALADGRFREDLFYRLRVVPIEIPPLRERREDIGPLAAAILSRIASQHGLVKRLSPQAMRTLLDHAWPGNVRELVNVIEYAVAVSRSETLLPEDFPPGVGLPTQEVPRKREADHERAAPPDAGRTESPDAAAVLAALETHRWRRADAARSLGMSRTTLWRRIRELKLDEAPKA